MKKLFGFLLIMIGALSTIPMLRAEDPSEEIQVTEFPVGEPRSTPQGKPPFKLVPIDPDESTEGGTPIPRTTAPAQPTRAPQVTIIQPEARTPSVAAQVAAKQGAQTPETPSRPVNQTVPPTATPVSPKPADQPVPPATTAPLAQPVAAPAKPTIASPIASVAETPTAPVQKVIPVAVPQAAAATQKEQLVAPTAPKAAAPQRQPTPPAQAAQPATPMSPGAPQVPAPAQQAAAPIGAKPVVQAKPTAPKAQAPATPALVSTKGAEKKNNIKQVPMRQEKGIRRLRDRRKIKAAMSMAEEPRTKEEAQEQERAIDVGQETQKDKAAETAENFETLAQTGGIYLGKYLEPWKGFDPNERVEMNFDNKELTELLKFLSNTFDITFILDDAIEPMRAEGLQPMAGTKITFKSEVPLTLKQAWEIGLTFIEMAGFSVIPSTLPRTYRVTVSASRDKPSANREPLPTFIGTDPELIPNNDTKIRYVYFADNAELSTIVQIIEAMKSGSAGPIIEVPTLRAIIMTDKAANIRSLISILQEIDKVSLPETLAIIRLRHTDARQVRELYYKLIGKDPQSPAFNPFARQRKPSTTQYFTEATRVFEEPYTNSLIVLGTRDNIKRFEDFILKYVDKTLDIPFSPLHVIQLKYMDAASIAKILNEIIQKFNADPSNTAAALVGGVRDTNKFFRPTVRITEETSGNRLIINADYDEYLKIRELIEKLDVEQPQVAIKVLILDVDLTDTKQIGVQLRNKVDCCDGTGGTSSILSPNVNFQTGNLGAIQTLQPATGGPPINGAERLLGNLIALADQVSGVSPFAAGTTLVTLGKDLFGFWGLLAALEMYTRVSIVANPFLTVTNKYKAEFKVGETQRTTSAIVEGQREAQAQADLSADLRVIVTPQISFDDMITLNVYVELGTFIGTTQNRLIKRVSTEALLANREVLALGGLIQDTITENITKVPFLGDIPLLGWFFKNKTKSVERSSLLILICPEIIKPHQPEVAQNFTYSKIADAKENLYSMRGYAERRDPIHRWFFADHKDKEASTIDRFVTTQARYIDESQRKPEIVAQRPPTKEKNKTTKTEKPQVPGKKGLLDLIEQAGERA